MSPSTCIAAAMIVASASGGFSPDARWIGFPDSEAPAFAKSFVANSVTSAVLTVTGIGYYEARINGRKVGRKVLDPTPTDYGKRVYYSVYDVTDFVVGGTNELSIILGNGLYNVRSCDAWGFEKAPWRDFPRGMATLDLFGKNGVRRVLTDATWRLVASPVAFNDFREGEVIISRPSNPPSERFAREVPPPVGVLTESTHPGAEVMREVCVKKVEPLADGSMLYDFGENMAGWARIRFSGLSDGDVVSIRYDERHPSEGKRHIDQHTRELASPKLCRIVDPATAGFQTDRFVSAGVDGEIYEPRFTYNGFRFVTLRGCRRFPTAGDVVGRFVRTAFPKTGTFKCSDATFNRLVAAAELAYECNFTDGVPTDCPHREKNGWLGDAALVVEFSQYAYGGGGNAAAYRCWVRSIMDQQSPSGAIPAIVPDSGWGIDSYSCSRGPAWGVALTTIPWTVYRFRSDGDFLSEAYPGMRKYVRKLISELPDVLSKGSRDWLGDWCAAKIDDPEKWWIPRVPSSLTSFAFAYASVCETAAAAEILGFGEDAAFFRHEAEKIKASFNRDFGHGDGRYGPGLPCAQAVALEFGLVPDALVGEARKKLVEAVHAEGDTIDFGILGSRTVFRALSDAGETDLAWKLIMRKDEPGFANWLERGATTLWESFGGRASRNHVMFGDFVAWAYAYIIGVRPKAPGFRKFTVNPHPPSALDWAKATVPTPHGEITAEWTRCGSGRDILLRLVVPRGTLAEVVMFDGSTREVGVGEHRINLP
ncbi:MAG: family 78 glycoside hydrolase catalytic domain [Kiritimatiellae bacterium]|nr:family 78 glycoside hydrolase catalytic domain [Kiritimatiellia bacterium]